MSVFHNNALIGAGAGTGEVAAAEYVIPKSLRFNSGDSSYLNRTPSSGGNRRIWTYSVWVKRHKLGTEQPLLRANVGTNAQNTTDIVFQSSDKLQVYTTISGSTNANKLTSRVFRDVGAWMHVVVSSNSPTIKIYVNGTEVTDFDTNTVPGSAYDTFINHTTSHLIGRNLDNGSAYSDFSLADVQLVDGQELLPTDFGETRSSDGVWVPKEFSFTSPNDGTTWSSDLTATSSGAYFATNADAADAFDGDLDNSAISEPNGSTITWSPTGGIAVGTSLRVYRGSDTTSNTVNISVNGGSSQSFGRSSWVDLSFTGTLTSLAVSSPSANPGLSAVEVDGVILVDGAGKYGKNGFHLNFSDSSTNEALGFDSAPTIPDADPKKGFDVVTYSGTGAVQNIGGLQFEPGLVWFKPRETGNHKLIDSVRGKNKRLESDTTDAEETNNDSILSFNPDGFTLGTAGTVNNSTNTFVAWTWRAGGPAVANTDGTINSQVSVNTDYGFSIVSYTGNGTAGATIGHGLGQTPKWILLKSRDSQTSNSSWTVHHTSVAATKTLYLNTTDAASTSGSWNDTAPGSSVFTVGTAQVVNTNAKNYIAYCWSEVSGYSKFSSYSGTGSTHTVDCGFRPAFLIVKSSTGSYNWQIKDNQRGDVVMFADTNAADTSDGVFDFTDNGFTVTGSGNATNASGQTYIFAAFADRPGNNWNVFNIATNEGLTTSKTQFDVVTWTGNGGDLKVGGPVYSSQTTGGNYPDRMFDGSGSTWNNLTAGNTLTFTPSPAISCTQLELWVGTDTPIRVNVNGGGYGSTFTQSGNAFVDITPGGGMTSLTSLLIDAPSGGGGSGAGILGLRINGTTILRDGNGGPGLKFQPDLVWIKDRSNAYSHRLADSVRGSTRVLFSDASSQEQVNEYGTIDSFNSDGFTLRQGSNNNGDGSNTNNANMVAWCWKAGGTAVSNTDGSITSSVSANAQYGFSIVTYTGTGSAATVGHGLSSPPSLILVKQRNGTNSWAVYSRPTGASGYLSIEDTNALNTSVSPWDNTDPTSSVFSIATAPGSNAINRVNLSGQNYVAYCFANVPGYQRIGSYIGNGSTNGPVVKVGFRPRFILQRPVTSGHSWLLLDTERDPSGTIDATLRAQNSNAESSFSWGNILDDGFEIKNTDTNPSGVEILYIAIGDDEIGSDEDCVVDVPNAVTADADATDTTGGYQRGNYATMNPLVNPNGASFSNGNLQVSNSTGWHSHVGTIGVASGKWYYEFEKTSGSYTGVGWRNDATTAGNPSHNANGGGIYLSHNGNKQSSAGSVSYGATWGSGDIVGVAFDRDAGTIEFYKNGVSQGQAFTGMTDGTFFPEVQIYQSGGVINFGQMRFKYPMPSGHAALNTTALPAATIADGSAQFEATTYAGNSSTQNITGINHGPDLVWIKTRNDTSYHFLSDSVRGPNKHLASNATDAEGTDTAITAFNSDGFSLANQANVNSSYNYVAWTWNAGANSNKTYTVKVVSDSGNKYRFDDFGTSAVTLDLAEGSTYVFDQSDSSNSGHPLRFSTTSDGTHGGGSEYTTGVTTTGTPGSAGAKTTIVVGSGVATLYYYCSAHSGMGGQANTNSTAGASNFDGSIQSTVKANPSAGFSIVSYTGTGTAATIGHGLNAAPELLIIKNRDGAHQWPVYLKELGAGNKLQLNDTAASASTGHFNSTDPTSSVFSVGTTSSANNNGDDHIAYCFAPVAGYSAMSVYSGNSSTDGPMVVTGFRPRFVLIKATNATANWVIHDSARDTFNEMDAGLYPHSTSAEETSPWGIDFLSNGFKLRTTNGGVNQTGLTYLYYAVAENPFQANGGLAR